MPEQVRNLQRADGDGPGDDEPPKLLRSEHRTPVIIAVVALVVLVLAGISVPVSRLFTDDPAAPGPVLTPSATPSTTTRPSASPSTPSAGPTTPSASATSPSTSPRSSASPATPPYERTTYDGEGALDNVLYNVYGRSGDGSCGGITVHDARNPLTGDALATELESLIDCSMTALKKPLSAVDITLSRPTLRVYHARTDSPCGPVVASENPAYYCPANETIYFPDQVPENGNALTVARLGYVDLLTHEFGHHLQQRAGIYDEYTEWYYAADQQEQLELTRRSELQAQCFSSVFVGHLSQELQVTTDDLSQLDTMHTMMGDDEVSGRPPTHGSAAAQLEWMRRGHGDGWSDYGRCNTWLATSDEVR